MNVHDFSLPLFQIEHKEVLPGSFAVQEHPISDPGDLPLAIVLRVHDQLLSAPGQGLLRVLQPLHVLRYNAVDVPVVDGLVELHGQEGGQLVPGFEVEGEKLFDADAGGSPRVFLVIGGLFFLVVVCPVEVEIVVDGENLGDSFAVQHFMDALGDHGEELVLVAVPEPKDEGVVGTQFVGELLVVVTDLALACDDPLQEETYLLLIILVHLLGNHIVVFLQQLVFLQSTQTPNLLHSQSILLAQLLVSLFIAAVLLFLFCFVWALPCPHCQVVEEGFSVVVGAAHNDGRLAFAFDVLQGGKGLRKILVPVVGILVEFEGVDHVVGHSLCFLLSDLGSHDGGVAVELLGIAADDFSLELLGQLDAQLRLAHARGPDDEHPQHQIQKNITNKLLSVAYVNSVGYSNFKKVDSRPLYIPT